MTCTRRSTAEAASASGGDMVLLRAHVTAGVQASVAHPGALRISDRSLRRGHIFEKAAPVAQHAGRWRCSSACGRAEHGPRHGHQEPAVTTSLRVSRMAKDHADQNQTGSRITLLADTDADLRTKRVRTMPTQNGDLSLIHI